MQTETETLSDKTISNVKPLSIYNSLETYLHIDFDKDGINPEGVEGTFLVMETPDSTDQQIAEKNI